MSRKWVEKEGPRWVKEGIVSPEQVNRILALYGEKQHAIGLLPILGSILVGLGILSFIAANWQDIHELVRLALLIAAMIGFYVAGERSVRSGHPKLGIAFVGLGVVSFGGGIVLIGQMFHLVPYNALSFILWACAATAATYLYRSRYLYLLGLLLFDVAQGYSVSSFHSFSYTAFALMVLTLGYYGWRRPSLLLTWCFSISIAVQAIMWITAEDLTWMWYLAPLMGLYALGDFLKDRDRSYALQVVPLIAAFLFAVSIVLFIDNATDNDLKELRAAPVYYMTVMLVLFGISLAGKLRQGRALTAFEWILPFPFLYLDPVVYDVVYLLALFLFSLYVLWRGYAEEWRFKINFGTILFLCSTLLAYGKLTWAFMDKSLFFVLGGLLLLGLGWFLNRRKKQFFDEAKEEKPHE